MIKHLRKLAGIRNATHRIQLGRAIDRIREHARRIWNQLLHTLHRLARDHHQELRLRFCLAQTTTEDAFEKRDAESKDVGPSIELFTTRLLGRHVGEFALEDAGLRAFSTHARDSRDAEIGETNATVARDENVRRRNIAMHDATVSTVVVTHGVHRLERLGDLAT